ncbi:DUF4260 domain-containing protein [Halobacillus kuroshimensis]|uniref:DUF4260 domain-containing protein n=1 Tax=Halobacillus kuroshimensis TaxID=302481 RepID=A0ABS3DRB7_9BACI|nr:DUF4260 domain-containing protein [Halobacillus kuroshimensis]
MPKLWIHLEGLLVLFLSFYFYTTTGYSLWLFLLLLLAPDVFMLGYIINTKAGAVLYNIGHTYVVPGLFLLSGLYYQWGLVTALALIWTAHIGMDRTIGYGLKYGTDFKHTHQQRI